MSMDAAPRGFWAGLKLRRRWPWLVLALMVVPAVWHVLDFDEDIDPEFPTVERPWFSVVPPAAYRLAEPGDTLDRVEIYLAAAGVMLAAGGLVVDRGAGSGPHRWPSAWPASGTARRRVRRSMAGTAWAGGRSPIPARPSSCARSLLAAALALAGVVAATAWRRRDRLGASGAALVRGDGLALDRGPGAGGGPAVRDPGRRATRLLASLRDGLVTHGLRPGPPDRTGAAPEIADEPAGHGRRRTGRMAGPGRPGDRRDVVSPSPGSAQDGRTGPHLYQCDAHAPRPGDRPESPSLPHDHQPLPRGDGATQSLAGRRVEICPRAWNSLRVRAPPMPRRTPRMPS